MAKTRNKAKISAVNNARTRAGKSKARIGDKDPVLEPVTARRKGKKKQAIRSPSPVAGPSGQPAGSPSPAGSLPPTTPHFEPSTQLIPNALSRNVALLKGWQLMKSYFDNRASADDVHKFLKATKEQELEEAFADITGCSISCAPPAPTTPAPLSPSSSPEHCYALAGLQSSSLPPTSPCQTNEQEDPVSPTEVTRKK